MGQSPEAVSSLCWAHLAVLMGGKPVKAQYPRSHTHIARSIPMFCAKGGSKGVEVGVMDLLVKSLTFMQDTRVCAM